jgi:hypothetical protein
MPPRTLSSSCRSALGGASAVISAVTNASEIVRTGPSPARALYGRACSRRAEGATTVIALVAQNADVQKVLAFEGVFEKLFALLAGAGGTDCDAPARDALRRFNPANQVLHPPLSSARTLLTRCAELFGETPYPPVLCTLLGFPPALPAYASAPQELSACSRTQRVEACVRP